MNIQKVNTTPLTYNTIYIIFFFECTITKYEKVDDLNARELLNLLKDSRSGYIDSNLGAVLGMYL